MAVHCKHRCHARHLWPCDALVRRMCPQNFSLVAAESVRALQKCNSTLFRNPAMLRNLPTAELAGYLQRCFGRGRAMHYVQTSAYAVCILHALRWFRRGQFLFLRYEDLVRSTGARILGKIGSFLGLHVDDELRRTAGASECDPSRSHRTSFASRSPTAPEDLASVVPDLEWLFGPYTTMLQELVGGEFRLSAQDHTLPPLDEKERARRREALASIMQKRAERVRKQRESAAQQRRAARAFRRQTQARAHHVQDTA
jgi:hypothetical protein